MRQLSLIVFAGSSVPYFLFCFLNLGNVRNNQPTAVSVMLLCASVALTQFVIALVWVVFWQNKRTQLADDFSKDGKRVTQTMPALNLDGSKPPPKYKGYYQVFGVKIFPRQMMWMMILVAATFLWMVLIGLH